MTVRENEPRSPALSAYDDVRSGAAVYDRGARGLISLAGRDAVSFLHNILTNDIKALQPGSWLYAAFLTPQGRMIADMTVIRRDEEVLLDVEPGVASAVARRLDESVFTEDVRVHDRSGSLASLAVHGPGAWAAVAPIVGAPQANPPAPGTHLTAGDAGDATLALSVQVLGAPGVHLFAPAPRVAAIAEALRSSGLPELSPDAFEALRIEAGTPVFGIDMTTDTIPLEAGIQDRAISMTKGCYPGQEVIVRILHRGHGRVARRLVGLVIDGTVVPHRQARLLADSQEAGYVTSAAFSPRLQRPVALAYVQRVLAEPGVTVHVEEHRVPATVTAFPLA